MDKNKMEMSTLYDHLPRYYKGFDIDVLMGRLMNREPLTEEERSVVSEVQKIYYEKYFEESRRKAEEWMAVHPGEYIRRINYSTKEQRGN